MQVVNFSHPLSAQNLSEIEDHTRTFTDSVINVPVDCDLNADLREQVRAIIDCMALAPDAWQVSPPVVVLPGHSAVAAVLLAELHGRMGHFPTVVRLAPVEDSTPRRFAVVELLNLQTVRDEARRQRFDTTSSK